MTSIKLPSLSSLKFITCVAAVLLAHTGNAVTVFDNGNQGGFGAVNTFSVENRFVSQDFQLTSDTFLDSLTFNAFTLQGVTQPLSAIRVKIYSDNAGVLGSELYSGSFAQSSAVYTDSYAGYDLYDFTAILPNWSLLAGSYWLALQVDPAQGELHWTNTGMSPSLYSDSYVGNEAGDPSSYTEYYGVEHVFRLTGNSGSHRVPDSGSSLGLVAAGLMGLACFRRRAQRA